MINATCAWVGGAPDVRFDKTNDLMVTSYDPANQSEAEEHVESLMDSLFPDHGPDLKYDFVFKDGNHYVSSWKGVQQDDNLFMIIPKGDLPAGSRECFVELLDYAEETLGLGSIFLCITKDRDDTAELLRTFMFLGFEVVHHSNCKLVPFTDEYMFMAYSFD